MYMLRMSILMYSITLPDVQSMHVRLMYSMTLPDVQSTHVRFRHSVLLVGVMVGVDQGRVCDPRH